VLNNHGYSTERSILDGSFNNIQIGSIVKSLDLGGKGFVIETEEQLYSALEYTEGHTETFAFWIYI